MSDYKWPPEGGGAGVTSVNTFTGAVEILPGTNITIDNSVPGEITINSSGGAAFIDSVVDTNSIDLTVTTGDLSADLKLSSAAAGGTDLKLTNTIETDGLLTVIPRASGSVDGYLDSADFTAFAAKQAAGNYITSLTGDVTASGPGAAAATIAAGVIVNSMVSGSAAIAYSKLSLTNSIVDADIASGAAIAFSKMANLTTARALVSDGSGDVSVATTTATEISYVNGVTSAIQTQLDAKIAKADFTTKGQILVATGSGTYTPLTVGLNDQVLTADSGQSSGVKWAAPVAVPRYSNSLLAANGTVAGYVTVEGGFTTVSATAGATYTNNGFTYTLLNTVNSMNPILYFSNSASATFSGTTLTKSAGTGPATLTIVTARTFALTSYTPTLTNPAIKVTLVGGGGGSGGAASGGAAAGGGGGSSTVIKEIPSASGTTYYYYIAAGGNAGAAGNNAGTDGQPSFFVGINAGVAYEAIAAGGNAGQGAPTHAAPTFGGSGGAGGSQGISYSFNQASVGDIIIPGGSGFDGQAGSTTQFNGGSGGSSSMSGNLVRTRASSPNGSAGRAGVGYGQGASGGATVQVTGVTVAGGAGGSGCVVIEEF